MVGQGPVTMSPSTRRGTESLRHQLISPGSLAFSYSHFIYNIFDYGNDTKRQVEKRLLESHTTVVSTPRYALSI